MKFETVLILGGGSAGLIAALTLRRLCPDFRVELARSPEIGIIGVGEGTTAVFPAHFFEVLRLPQEEFYREARPIWKQGIRFLWGGRGEFFYSFDFQYDSQRPGMPMPNGYYCEDDCDALDLPCALMQAGKALATGPLGKPLIRGQYGFHVENRHLVAYLERAARERGVSIYDDTLEHAETGPAGISELVFRSGARRRADFYVDASGFRAELIGKALGEPFRDFSGGLFCDRAVTGGWPRGADPIRAYTTAETMDAGWCWRIDHEDWINRGYVYSSAFVSDEEALEEFLRKNPEVANEPRVIRFRSGRYERNWVGNVLAVGNASGFVEPLEATALAQMIYELRAFIDLGCREAGRLDETARDDYNRHISIAWDEIRDFLAYHYKFNDLLDTPFWRHCREETSLGDYEAFHQLYRELGPSPQTIRAIPHRPNIYGTEGFLTMLVGMKVPHAKPHRPGEEEWKLWRRHQSAMKARAAAGATAEQALAAIRRPDWNWG